MHLIRKLMRNVIALKRSKNKNVRFSLKKRGLRRRKKKLENKILFKKPFWLNKERWR